MACIRKPTGKKYQEKQQLLTNDSQPERIKKTTETVGDTTSRYLKKNFGKKSRFEEKTAPALVGKQDVPAQGLTKEGDAVEVNVEFLVQRDNAGVWWR